MKVSSWVTHALFRCAVCNKEWENYVSAQRLAAEHARKFKHLVTGEIGTAYEYNGKAQP
jgi:hypothetical protein